MLDPGALGTLIIRNGAERADAERVAAGVPETVVQGERGGIRVAMAHGLRRLATRLAGPEATDAAPTVTPVLPSIRLTWSDR